MTVLIVAREGDLHAHAVADAVRLRGGDVLWVDLADLSTNQKLSLALADRATARLKATGRELELTTGVTVWWRRPRPPAPPPGLGPESEAFVASEWERFLEALEPCADVRWVNRPSAARTARSKPVQFRSARARGLRVPRTLITNDADAVRSLIAEGRPLIYKRISDGPVVVPTRALSAADAARLDDLQRCPAVFQERVDARLDVRVTAIGRELIAAEIDSQAGDSPLDWRFDHSVAFRPHELPADTAQALVGVMQDLGLVVAAIDLRLTPEGEYVFLEVNPGGQFLFVELLAGVELSGRVADLLMSNVPCP